MYSLNAKRYRCIEDSDASNQQWIKDFSNKHVLYMLQLEDNLYKLGRTDNLKERCMHNKRDYGQYKIVKVWETFNNVNIEKRLLKDFGIKGMRRQKEFNGSKRDELFALTDTTDLSTVMQWVDDYVDTELHPALEQQRIIQRDQEHAREMERLQIEKLRLQVELAKMNALPIVVSNDDIRAPDVDRQREYEATGTFAIPHKHGVAKPVRQVDPETGQVVREFASVTEAAEAMDTYKGNITTAASQPGHLSCGFQWSYVEDRVVVPTNKFAASHHRNKAVQQMTTDGSLVFTYTSVKDAAANVGKHISTIKKAIYTQRPCVGFRWAYV